MKKKLIILSAVLITLSATFAFRNTSETAPVKEEKVAVSNNGTGNGFVLQDQNQWK